MDDSEDVARRISAACADLQDQAAKAGLDGLALILKLAISEADKDQSRPTAPH